MNGRELRAALAELGLSQRWLAARLGVYAVTVWRWCNSDGPIPKHAAFVIDLLRRLPARELAALKQ